MCLKTFLFVFILLGNTVILPKYSLARHRCPEPPDYKFSIFSSQFFVATSVASSIASGRTSNTSGCDRGHPSDEFYRPSGAIYLDNNMNWVMEESSKGQGSHLDALASLAGCQSATFPFFSRAIQRNYRGLFDRFKDLEKTERADRIWFEIEEMVFHNRKLRQACPKTS
ncbi:MAG: DUF3015 family protein [SAR324 cluster bacterium]|nr:DUF3015 family protein [SAR324 cluster bacterium]